MTQTRTRWVDWHKHVHRRMIEEQEQDLELLIDTAVEIYAEQPGKGIKLDPATLYHRTDLLELGMSRRLVNSLSSASVYRGQYMGSAVIAELEGRAKAIASRHPVKFNGRLQHGRR